VLTPFLVVFAGLPLIGRSLPAYDERAFLMTLPLILLAWGWGLNQSEQAIGLRWTTWFLAALLLLPSFFTLDTYFTRFNKSPEGALALSIAAQAQPGDCVAADRAAYSAAIASQYYLPNLPLLVHTGTAAPVFLSQFSLLHTAPKSPEVGLEAFDACRRVWVVWRGTAQPSFLPVLFARFPTTLQQLPQPPGPFNARLIGP
jgi:hypothetical protein